MKHEHSDHEALENKEKYDPIKYPKPDGIISFDRLTNVSFSGTNHEENQPCHLQLKDVSVPIKINLNRYDNPETRYCPQEFMRLLRKITKSNYKLMRRTVYIVKHVILKILLKI